MRNEFNEIRNLAVHHWNILANKFPQYSYHVDAFGSEDFIRMRVDAPGGKLWLLSINFSLTSIRVLISRLNCRPDYPRLSGTPMAVIESAIDLEHNFRFKVINYADPKFTDDFLSNILKEQERDLQNLKI